MRVAEVVEVLRAARNLARDNVRPGEEVLVLSSTDQHASIHDALLAACEEAGAGRVASLLLVPEPARSGYRHPAMALAAARAADLTIVATSLAFPRAYDDMTEAVLSAGRRLVLINNAPPEDFARGASLADPAALNEATWKLARAVSAAKRVRVRTTAGTDLTVGVCRPCMVLTGHADDHTGFGSFPSGEAMLSVEEGTAEGRFVADAFGQVVYLEDRGPQIGMIEDPILLDFRAGRLVELSGGTAAARLRTILEAADEAVRCLAELGLGTNPMARRIAHVENKFRLGTAHIALGDNHLIGWRAAQELGGTLRSGRHIDLVADDVTVELDGQVVVAEGRLLL
jgi:leucyl aminopeptidase (aminopeptidase T)